MPRTVRGWLGLFLAAAALCLPTTGAATRLEAGPDQWVVWFDRAARDERGRVTSLVAQRGGRSHALRHVPFLLVQAEPETAAAVRAMPGVRAVIADDALLPPETIAGERAGRAPWAFDDAVAAVGAPAAWDQGLTGRGWAIAFIDTGLLASHEIFQGKQLDEACFAAQATCPNGATEMFGAGASAPAQPSYAAMWHGTHLAALATGAGASGHRGVAPEADLIAINVFNWATDEICAPYDRCVVAYISDIAAALDWLIGLVEQGRPIAAVNMSLEGPAFPDEQSCFQYAPMLPIFIGQAELYERGVAFSASAGDEALCGALTTPACLDTVMAVGAAKQDGFEASFSNYDPLMTAAYAPGFDVLSAVGPRDTDYRPLSSTGVAAALVSGALTLLRQQQPRTPPGLLVRSLEERTRPLVVGCPDVGSQGLVDLPAALTDPERVPLPSTSTYLLAVFLAWLGSTWYRKSAAKRLSRYWR